MAKTKVDINSRDQRFRGFNLEDRAIGTRTSYAVVTYFHYKKQNFVDPSNVKEFQPSYDVEVGTIDADIAEITVSKSLNQASGTFGISLNPSKNWKSVLSPGDWVMIYFFNTYNPRQIIQDTKNCVLVGSIDRVSRSLARNEDEDKVQLRYNVSGRNFGKVFEEQDVWFDPYAISVAGGVGSSELDVWLQNAGLELAGSPNQLADSLIGIFLGDKGQTQQGVKDGISAWGIPPALASRFKSEATESPRFKDILKTEIATLPGYKAREQLTVNSNGSLWDMLERNSNGLINECYLEESRASDGSVSPTFFLKPRPLQTPFLEDFANKGSANLSLLGGAYQTLQDLAKNNYIEISQSEIKYEDLGKDDHARMNFYWLRFAQSAELGFEHVANLNKRTGIRNPVYSRESIQRHGLKRMDQSTDFCYLQQGAAIGAQYELWKAFMAQLWDMHSSNHLYDAGTIECTGVLEAELGKALIVRNARAGERKKIYFIEGYEHRWSLTDGWSTVFTLTHGQWQTDGKDIFIDASLDDFGSPDSMITSSYIAKTETER